MKDNNIKVIVLTGGPGAGKTSALSRIEQELEDRGYQVVIVPEVATLLISGGTRPDTVGNIGFQKTLLSIQLMLENTLKDTWKQIDKEIVVVCDRGAMDCRAYMDREMFSELLKITGVSRVELMDRYDAVIHLKTAADGVEEFYTLENNKARSETPELARELDKKTLNGWVGHSHLRVIGNETKVFSEKLDKVMKEVYALLGVPVPLEIERKYLVEYPDLIELLDTYKCTDIDIIQTYLKSDDNIERRIRQRGSNGEYSYYLTLKEDVDGISRLEKETKIEKEEYLRLLMDADTNKSQIRKTRYCFIDNDRYFELDVYPFWNDKAILEIELTDKNESVEIPKMFKVIKEVTEDKRYKNSSLAENHNI